MKRGRKRKPGRKRGTKVPATPAMIRASRTNAWKHGAHARVVSAEEVALTRVRQRDPEAVAVHEAVLAAMLDGDMRGMDLITSNALSEAELMRRQAVDSVNSEGVLLKESLVNADGQVIGSRLKGNPAAEIAIELGKQLGHTASDQLLSRKARGEGAVDAALAMRLARDEKLRGLIRGGVHKMPPPPGLERGKNLPDSSHKADVIDVTAEDKSGSDE